MAEQVETSGTGGGAALDAVLVASTVPQVWDALAQWVEVWQPSMGNSNGGVGFDDRALVPACRQLVGHLGALDWQGVPPERLSRSRSLTVEMHRQLMLLQTDLRFLAVTRQKQRRSQLLAQVGDRFRHIGGYCTLAQQYLNLNGETDNETA